MLTLPGSVISSVVHVKLLRDTRIGIENQTNTSSCFITVQLLEYTLSFDQNLYDLQFIISELMWFPRILIM